MLPENPPWLARLTAELPTLPTLIVRISGLKESVKSGRLEANTFDFEAATFWKKGVADNVVKERRARTTKVLIEFKFCNHPNS